MKTEDINKLSYNERAEKIIVLQQEIERLKVLLEKEFKNFRDTDSVERRWQKFKTKNNIEDAAIYTGNSLK